MISQQTLKGNLVLQDYTTAFTLNQGDKGVPFRIELLENGTSYTLLSTDTVSIEWLKPNGKPFLQDGDIIYGTNYIEIITPEAVAQYSGTGTFNIIIADGTVRKGTIRREYKVIPTSMKPDSVSEDVITDALTELRELNSTLASTIQTGNLDNYAKKTYVNKEVDLINFILENKANKSDMGSPVIANTAAEMTDTTKIYIYTGSETGYTKGNWYGYNGTSWVNGGTYGSSVIADKSIISDKTNFLEQKNLAFYKNIIHGYKMQGDGSGMTLIEDTNFYVACINIKPNTTYSLILPEDLGLEDGYYWLKVATSTSTREEVIDSFSNSYTFDGSYKYTKTDGYLYALWVNTGTNDKSVFIQLGKYKQPSYFEFLEGQVNGRRYNNYIDSVVPLFNAYNKKEIDDMINGISPNNNKLLIKKESSNSYVTIFYKYTRGYVGYRYGAYGDASINLNTYRLIDIKTYDSELNAQYTISNAPYDNEGVLKIQGESDYIGGVHGDEKNPVLSVMIDGKMVGFNDITQCYCDEIKFIVTSDIYHCDDTTSKAFKKTKQTWFDINGVHVNNKWIAQETINLEHVRACLLSINKYDSTTKLITHYYDDKVLTAPQGVPELNSNYTVLATDKSIDNVFFTGLIQAEVWGVRGGDESEYYSQITDFGDRIKPYFDCYTGKTLAVNDILTCQNNFIIRYN